MSTKNKQGREPISQKAAIESSDFSHDDLDFNLLKIDPELKAQLDKEGFAFRWINAPKYLAGGNFHQSGWRAYRMKRDEADRGAVDFNFGVSPEGYIIRNDLILAVKPKEQQERWKKHLKKKADLQSGVEMQRADELRSRIRESGFKAKIHEGYDENGEE